MEEIYILLMLAFPFLVGLFFSVLSFRTYREATRLLNDAVDLIMQLQKKGLK